MNFISQICADLILSPVPKILGDYCFGYLLRLQPSHLRPPRKQRLQTQLRYSLDRYKIKHWTLWRRFSLFICLPWSSNHRVLKSTVLRMSRPFFHPLKRRGKSVVDIRSLFGSTWLVTVKNWNILPGGGVKMAQWIDVLVLKPNNLHMG